jgi:hypothetical protein
MLLTSLFNCRKTSAQRLRGTSPRRPRGYQLRLEPLEDRALPSASLLFDTLAGDLTIRPDAGDNTVRQAFTANGFLDVTLDGRHLSSDPASALFDKALAGATNSSLRGIRFERSGGQETLTLDSENLSGDLFVSAAGAAVVTEDVTVAGHLMVQAQSITVSGAVHGAAIALAGSGWVTIEAGGLLAADRIDVSAGVFVNSGQVRADGLTGGEVVVSAANVLNGGRVSADGGGAGGRVWIGFTGSYVDTSAAVTSADGQAGSGGSVTLDGGGTGHLFSSGRHEATGAVGGQVDLFGRDIELVGATVDASGQAGGGVVHIGGDFHGGPVGHVNAQTVSVTAATTIRADARDRGDGGRVIVWADQDTTFDGTVTARGGLAGGNGGFIEVSGLGNLSYGGTADTAAPVGQAGTLLLDPKNLVIDAVAGALPQFNFVDPHPTTGGHFGDKVRVLSGGNVVVTNPGDNFRGNNAGAVYLYDGLTGALLSSLVGSSANDTVGSGGVIALSNGNYVVGDLGWNGGRGAVTWGSGTAGVTGTVSAANSLTGTNPGDLVGFSGVIALSNGNYVVGSPNWNGYRGAATWGSGTAGVTGTVSAANSLIGSLVDDQVGLDGITPLSNGNYVVGSSAWNGNRGAATWGSGTASVSDTVSSFNSLIGMVSGVSGDQVGSGGVTALSNGNYVVASPHAFSSAGLVTWCNGTTGITTGTISSANSLSGSSSGSGDQVSSGGVTALSNGNYVVSSPGWNGNRGAATLGSGTAGVMGLVSSANSLTGSNPNDFVSNSGVTALTNGNYVVSSPAWNSNRGAATWASGTAGVNGAVSAANSLIGGTFGDTVGSGGITALVNGNYVVVSPHNGINRGAATWGSGTTGIIGNILLTNSLNGAFSGDSVGINGVVALSNGNYVVNSPNWSGFNGAATWSSGTAGVTGYVTAANSLTGSTAGDKVGNSVTALSNGNYVVGSPNWNGTRGAATWGGGSAGVTGTVSAANSLVGSTANDMVGLGTTALSNGNYVVSSFAWNGYRGAATWGSGTAGVSGTVSASNSLVGSSANDQVANFGITVLTNGNYVVDSQRWDSFRGAATWASGTSGQTLDGSGTITPQNSLVGLAANAGFGVPQADPSHQAFVAAFASDGSGRVASGFVLPNQLTYARGQSQTVTITPALLTRTLNTGGAVVLSASNDITINSPITVSAGGSGGALTLQAGRSIFLGANITTDNGSLTLIANDRLAGGVVDAQRDPGNADITMGAGTTLNTGTGALAVLMRDGAGKTNSASGAIALQTVSASTVSVTTAGTGAISLAMVTASTVFVTNNGTTAGSDLVVGPVTSTGSQTYSSSNGTTVVAGNLSAGSQITFQNSVALGAGQTVTAPAVNFPSSGLQTLSGPDGSLSNLVHNGSGTLRLTSNVTVAGAVSNTNSLGVFDISNQALTVGGNWTWSARAFLAAGSEVNFNGTADQALTSRGKVFNDLAHSGSGTLTLLDALTIAGNFTNSAGGLVASNRTVTVAGDWTWSGGTFTSTGSIAIFNGGASQALTSGGQPFNQVLHTGAGTLHVRCQRPAGRRHGSGHYKWRCLYCVQRRPDFQP